MDSKINDRKGEYQLKFKIINGKKHEISEKLNDEVIKKIHFLQDKRGLLEDQTTTILSIIDAGEQIIGGLSLVKRELRHLQEDIRRLIPTGTFYQGYVWECSTLCFAPPQDLIANWAPSEYFSCNFYRRLYEGLVEFGKQKEVGFVVVKLTAEAYPPTKDLGKWPYIIQFLPREFPDDLFYGILPLRGCFYKIYQKNWEDLDEG